MTASRRFAAPLLAAALAAFPPALLAEEPAPKPAPAPAPVPAPDAVPAAPSGEKVELRVRLKKGERYRYGMEMEQTIVQEVGGREMEIVQSTGFVYAFDVLEALPDGAYAMECVFESARTKSAVPGMEFEYDSKSAKKDEPVPAPARPLAALVGGKFRCEFDALAKCRKVEGMAKLLDDMLDSIPTEGVPDPETFKATMRKALGGQFGDEAMKGAFSQSFGYLPPRPVAVGESWEFKASLRLGFALDVSAKYTLKERKDGRSILAFEGTVVTPAGAEPMDAGMMKMRADIEGSLKGTFEIEEASGWIRSGSSEMEMKGKMTVISDGADGMEVPLRSKAKVRLFAP